MAGLPKALEQFLARYVHSVYELELLLMLRDHPEKEWGPLSASRALYIQKGAAAARLKDLYASGFLERTFAADEPLYRYKPVSEELASSVDELARAYENYRVRITSMIVNNTFDGIRRFADAFNIRNEDEEQ
jgi:hypothetical protein